MSKKVEKDTVRSELLERTEQQIYGQFLLEFELAIFSQFIDQICATAIERCYAKLKKEPSQ